MFPIVLGENWITSRINRSPFMTIYLPNHCQLSKRLTNFLIELSLCDKAMYKTSYLVRNFTHFVKMILIYWDKIRCFEWCVSHRLIWIFNSIQLVYYESAAYSPKKHFFGWIFGLEVAFEMSAFQLCPESKLAIWAGFRKSQVKSLLQNVWLSSQSAYLRQYWLSSQSN